MKFLCVSCDEQLKLKETQGPDEGSFTIIFRCPKCEREFAMLTNPFETQLVSTLDVKIGGRSVQGEPMEATRTFLKPVTSNPSPTTKSEDSPGNPSTEIVNEADDKDSSIQKLVWLKEAEERLGKIPKAVRSMAKMGVEHYARDKGYKEITIEILEEAKEKFGM